MKVILHVIRVWIYISNYTLFPYLDLLKRLINNNGLRLGLVS